MPHIHTIEVKQTSFLQNYYNILVNGNIEFQDVPHTQVNEIVYKILVSKISFNSLDISELLVQVSYKFI
jgi:hypothetical protein